MESIAFTDLPTVGTGLGGGVFAGIITRKDGAHCAVVLLLPHCDRLIWTEALDWAAQNGGELPSRPVAALLFANLREKLRPFWHWTFDEYDASFAHDCYFKDGAQSNANKSFDCSAVAVRLIPIKKNKK